MFHLNNEQIRSIGCGPIGAVFSAIIASVVFNLQVKRWSHRMPEKFGRKGKNELLIEYKTANRIAKMLALAGFCTILLYYRRNHEWTGAIGGGSGWRLG